ncbi:hypothetical protein [Stenomitos frigidus]|nr:hypothetical protein [Stenomitos frigidus]
MLLSNTSIASSKATMFPSNIPIASSNGAMLCDRDLDFVTDKAFEEQADRTLSRCNCPITSEDGIGVDTAVST